MTKDDLMELSVMLAKLKAEWKKQRVPMSQQNRITDLQLAINWKTGEAKPTDWQARHV